MTHNIANAHVTLIHVRRDEVLSKTARHESRRSFRELGLPFGIMRRAI